MTLPRLLEVALLEMPQYLEAVFEQLPDSLLRIQPSGDKSPLLEHLLHVHDCEAELYAPRILRTLSEHDPYLEPMAVGHWPSERQYLKQQVQPALSKFSVARRNLAAIVAACTEAQLNKRALRVEGRTSTVLDLVTELLEHDQDHRVRISAILASLHAKNAA